MTEPRSLDLSFATSGNRTVLDRRRYRWPQTIGRMFYLDADDPGHGRLIVQNAGASLHPGDHVRQRIAATAGARAEVTGQGAMLVTGLPGSKPAVEETELRAEASSMLIYQPEPRILTRFAHVVQNTHVELERGGSVMLTDAVVAHPDVTAESFGSFRSRVTLTVDGDMRLFDAQHASAMPNPRAGLRAFATVYLLGPAAEDPAVDLDRFDAKWGVYAAGSVLPNDAGYAIRIAATGGDTVREAIRSLIRSLRHAARARNVDPSREWHPPASSPTWDTGEREAVPGQRSRAAPAQAGRSRPYCHAPDS